MTKKEVWNNYNHILTNSEYEIIWPYCYKCRCEFKHRQKIISIYSGIYTYNFCKKCFVGE